MRNQRLRRRRLWRRQPVRLAVGHLLSHRGDPRLRGTRAGSLAAQCARPPDDFGRDRRALRGYLGPSDSRPLATFVERSQLRELGAVRVLFPPLVDVGLQVADGQADRELAPTTCCSLSGSSLMTTRSASENPLDTRNGAPFSTISMTHSPGRALASRSIAGMPCATDSGHSSRWPSSRLLCHLGRFSGLRSMGIGRGGRFPAGGHDHCLPLCGGAGVGGFQSDACGGDGDREFQGGTAGNVRFRDRLGSR